VNRAVFAAVVGNVFEFYDFVIYSTAAALVFGRLFFPAADPALASALASGSFFAGFLSRPAGALLFGTLGDRFGRKLVMVATLAMMGGATFGIAFLPTYGQAGLWAPCALLALRLLQGIAAGGEWGGSILMAVESAPREKRGLFGAWSQSGIGLAFVLANLIFYLAQQLPAETFDSWGWRIPFLASAPIFAVGLFIRSKVRESRDFAESAHANQPLRELARTQPRQMVAAAGLRLAEMGGSYLMNNFSLAYGVMVGVSAHLLLLGVVISMLADSVLMLFFGWLSDRIGRRRVYFAGIVAMALSIYPALILIAGNSPAGIFAALLLTNGLCHAAMVGVQPSMLTELFPVRVRSSGLATAQAVSAVLAGAVPVAALALFHQTRSPAMIALLFGGIAMISAVSLLLARPVDDPAPL